MFRPRLECSAFGCCNRTVSKPELSFFELPEDAKRRKQWLKLMMRNDLMDKEGIFVFCEVHFADSDIHRGTNWSDATLLKLSVPYKIYLKKGMYFRPATVHTSAQTDIKMKTVTKITLGEYNPHRAEGGRMQPGQSEPSLLFRDGRHSYARPTVYYENEIGKQLRNV